jgi:nucleoside-diphosphate-sugar epimerase
MSLPPSNGKTLLVTGINGYIASSLGELILQKGYNLRGTSRTLASTEPLLKGAYAPYASRVEILEVPFRSYDADRDWLVPDEPRRRSAEVVTFTPRP